jgi:2-polyprenyl-6-methoxyphenol hydroxylase-like FAD-dependent oxidoreductase
VTIPFDHLRTRYRFVAFVPQWDFLDFLAREARQYRSFDLRMSAEVTDLIAEDGVVRGVRYRTPAGEAHEVRALLTVGADGRDSRTRALLGLPIVATSPPIDVLWFRLPRRPEDPRGPSLRFGAGQIVVAFDRATHWQVAQVVAKGEMADVARVRLAVDELVPWLGDRVGEITDGGIRRLTVRSDRLRRWYAPGYLAIGDAAHAMSPIGGVGINVAIQDAVVAANVVCAPLGRGRVTEADLRRVQRRRVLQVRLLQAVQNTVHRRVLAPTLNGQAEAGARMLRVVGVLRRQLARLVALGPFRPRVRTPAVATA